MGVGKVSFEDVNDLLADGTILIFGTFTQLTVKPRVDAFHL